MVYDLSLKKINDIFDRLPVPFILGNCKKGLQNKLAYQDALYFEACYFLKSKGVPKDWPEIKKAEELYMQGHLLKANEILYYLWEEIDILSQLEIGVGN